MAKICFYGGLADALGRERDIPLPPEGCTIGELRALIARLDPEVATSILRPGIRGTIDDRFVDDSALVGPGQQVEFMSPLSGG